ncbi:hypothetical protein [Bartonella sp. CL435QHHD]|uniref:hypothetical protein n=1 Tax=Bartonella sp. CL435QHHD TaxID=3243530 RepID=UPI0035CFB5E0
MFQNHNSIGQNNTEQNKGRQNNTWIGDSHSKTRQHRPFCSHHKSRFPHTRTSTGTPTQDTPACTTPSQASAPPFLHPSSFPPSSFPQGATSHALGKQTPTQPFQKNSMKSKLFGNKPTPSTQASQQDSSMHHTLTGIRPTFLHPSFFPPSSFSQGATSHALGKQTPTQPFQKNSMKSKLFGNKPTPSTQASQQDSSMHHTLTGIRPTFLHPSFFPPSSFSQGATSHALGKQTPTQPFQKNSMKSKLFGNKPTPSTQASQQDSSMHHTLTGIRPTFLHPSFFPPSSFSQGATSHALGKQTPTQPFQKNSMKSKLFGNKPTPSTQASQQDSSMHHTLTGIRPTFLHPSFFPPSSFSQGATSHALGKQTPTQPFQKNSMKSKLFGNKPTPSTQGHPPPHRHPNTCPNRDTLTCTTPTHAPTGHSSMHHTLTGIRPTLLASFLLSPPSSFPLPPFLKAPLPMLLARRHQHSHFKKV